MIICNVGDHAQDLTRATQALRYLPQAMVFILLEEMVDLMSYQLQMLGVNDISFPLLL
jgi:hypothetical protein